MKKFKEFLKEAPISIVATPSPSKRDEILGQLDSDQENFKATLQRIQNISMEKSFDFLVEKIFEKNKILIKNQDLITNLMLRYYKGDPKIFNKLQNIFLKNKEYYFDYTKEVPIDLSNIDAQYSDFFVPDFFSNLKNLELKGKPVVGKGEAYLMILTQLKNSTIGGDLMDGSNKLEVKIQGGRLGGQKIDRDGITAMNNINQIIGRNIFRTKGFGKKACQDIIDFFDAKGQKFSSKSKEIAEIIENLSNYNIVVKKDFIIEFMNIIKSKNTNRLESFIIALHMIGYQFHEKWDYLLLFDNKQSQIICFSPKGQNISSITNFIENNNIFFSGSWSNQGADRMGVSIEYKG